MVEAGCVLMVLWRVSMRWQGERRWILRLRLGWVACKFFSPVTLGTSQAERVVGVAEKSAQAANLVFVLVKMAIRRMILARAPEVLGATAAGQLDGAKRT